MKRFLVSISGRSNLGSKGCKLRDYEICCAYVHGKSKAEAISKFWEQLEKNPLISKYYSRRDFRIEAERWESDQLSFNGEPLGDFEWALPFDQLACAVWNNKTNKLESAEIINKNLKAEMLNEMAQADDQESAPRMQKTSKRLEIAKAEIDKWNRMAESVKGTNSWALFNLWQDGIDHNGKWFDLGNDHNIRAHMIPHPSDCYFIKKIKGNTWLYFEDCAGIQERWLLSDLAIAFFLPEPSQESSSDNSKEIIKEISTEATGSNLEAQKATSAVEFEKISDYEIKASWKGEMIGKITISYKSYSPVSKIYRVNGNIDEKFEFLDDAKMHLIQNFRAQAHEYLKQLERNSASATAVVDLRNKIDALDDQIAELFIKGAEMRTGKEA